jgi:hypothetical protein
MAKTDKLFRGMKPTWGHLTFTRWCKICNTKFEANTPNEKFCRSECHEINRWLWKRNNNLKKLYGIDEEHYLQALRTQNGRCKICETTNPGGSNTNFCVDHDHKTGKVRGLLCNNCNGNLSIVEHRQEWIEKARVYLSV